MSLDPLTGEPDNRPPSDPLDTPLPCDIKIGGGTIRKGCKLRTLVHRMEALHQAAFGDEAQAIKLLRKVATVTNPDGEINRFLRDHDALVTMLASSSASGVGVGDPSDVSPNPSACGENPHPPLKGKP